MDSNTTSDDGSIELNDRGAGMTATRTVGGAYSLIEIPDHVDDDADLEITGHALDDEPSVVTLRINGVVGTSITLDVEDAFELADAIATAADEVDR